MRRAMLLALGAVGLAAGVVAVNVARRSGAYALFSSSPRQAIELAAGWSLLAVGLADMTRRRSGALFAAAGIAFFLPEWNNPGADSALIFTVGLVLGLSAPALVTHACLAPVGGRLTNLLDRVAVVCAYGGSIVLLGLLPAAVFDPARAGCSECPSNLLLVHGGIGAYDWLTRLAIRVAPVWLGLALVALGRRLVRASRAEWRWNAPTLAASAIYLSLVAGDAVHSARRGYIAFDAVDRWLWLAQALALIGLALALLEGRFHTRRVQDTVAQLVVQLTDRSFADSLGRVLSDAPMDAGIAEAAALALENERLRAEARAQVEELRQSRARIVAAGDEERQRLERDLHDGAQQRLVALSLALRVATSKDARLEQAQDELRLALADLRELAHGIFPTALHEDGLGAALEGLAESGALVIAANVGEERFAPTVETTAYFIVAEAVAGAAAQAEVAARHLEGVLTIELQPVSAAVVSALTDRVGAIDGTVVFAEGTLRVELPL